MTEGPMTEKPPDLQFHENARAVAVQRIRRYGERLIRESVLAAKARHHPIVRKKDVQYAAQRLSSSGRNRKGVLLQIVGAGLLGVFIQGFTAEMLAPTPNPWVAVVYVVIGFAGVFSVFWSLIR